MLVGVRGVVGGGKWWMFGGCLVVERWLEGRGGAGHGLEGEGGEMR